MKRLSERLLVGSASSAWGHRTLTGPAPQLRGVSVPGTARAELQGAVCRPAGVHAPGPSRGTPTHLANFTVAAFRGTNPVWNWSWNIFMDAICRETRR